MAVILPNNGRPRAILNVTSTAKGKSTAEIVVENDAISLTYYVDSIATDAYIDIKIEELGDTSTNKRTILEFDRINKTNKVPVNTIFIVPGKIKITATYSGVVDFEIMGKSLSAGAVPIPAAVLSAEESEGIAEGHRNSDKIIELLTKINNHLRLASGMEESDTDIF